MTSATGNILVLGSDTLAIPSDLPAPALDTGEVVLLLIEPEASRSGWSNRATLELARHWSASGLRVIVADGDLADAPLHASVSVENGEGVADLLLYGTSPYRVARQVEGEQFLLITAGTVVSDPEKIWRHVRWPGLLAAFRESGCVLVLCLPADDPGIEALLPEGDRIFRLSASPTGEPEPGVLLLVPEISIAFGKILASALQEAELEELKSAAAVLPEVGGAPIAADAEEGSAELPLREDKGPAEAVLVPEPAPPLPRLSKLDRGSARPIGTRRTPWIIFSVLLVVGILLALVWLGYLPLPGSGSSPLSGSGNAAALASLTLLSPFSG